MRDVEELLRQTLADPRRRLTPGAGLYDDVRIEAGARRRNRWIAASSAAAVVAIAAAATTFALSGRHGAPTTTPATVPPSLLPSTTISPAHGALGADVNVGDGWPQTVAMSSDGGLYALTSNPSEVVQLDPTGSTIRATVPGPSGSAGGIAVGGGVAWAWSQQTGDIRAYDESSLQPLGTFHTAAQSIFEGAIVGGQLWLTMPSGLVHTPAWPTTTSGALQVVAVPAVGSGAYGLGIDAARNELFVGVQSSGGSSFTGVRIVALNALTGKVLATSPSLGIGKESIAVVDGQVWVGGYGNSPTPLVRHLDEQTLQPVGSTPAAPPYPGAILWPGENVVWVRNGGSEQLSCLDPRSGQVLAQWPVVQGPVVSSKGQAYAIAPSLKRLTLAGHCTG